MNLLGLVKPNTGRCVLGKAVVGLGLLQMPEMLRAIPGKVIVLTGSQQPARFHSSNAIFNIGAAVAAAQTLDAGVYIAMNGRIFDPDQVRKNSKTRRFEPI